MSSVLPQSVFLAKETCIDSVSVHTTFALHFVLANFLSEPGLHSQFISHLSSVVKPLGHLYHLSFHRNPVELPEPLGWRDMLSFICCFPFIKPKVIHLSAHPLMMVFQ